MNRVVISFVKVCAVTLITALSVLCASDSHAQSNPPFWDPSLDSNCYFPQIENKSDMDTIVGSMPNQYLGSPFIKNLGPKPDGSYGNLLIGNLIPPPQPTPSNIFYTLSQVETGPGFNLHKMKQHLQKLNPDDNSNGLSNEQFRLLHFRDRAHLDLFVPALLRIYLADDAGNYDSLRFAVIMSALHGDKGTIGHNYSFEYDLFGPYTAHLTQDTVDDIVTSIYTDWKSGKDTSYLLLFKGRSSLHAGDTLFEDTSCVLTTELEVNPYRHSIQGDFRGTGREDLIIAGDTIPNWPGSRRGDLFFFANDPPFTLEKLAHAIQYDTLMARWQNPTLLSVVMEGVARYYGFPGLPKRRGDRSIDFVPVFYDTAGGKYGTPGIYFFRGGPDFGSHRITLDSAAYVIKRPAMFQSTTWPDPNAGLVDVGDMTGTGNRVMLTTARQGDTWHEAFYVTGAALDDKIDMYNSHPYVEPNGDTLTANNDGLQDYMFSLPLHYYDLPSGVKPHSGSIWLYYGTKKIPVHLNPKFADVQIKVEEQKARITVSPNPVPNGSTVATIEWPKGEIATFELRNLLGQLCEAGSLRLIGGAEQQRMNFPNLASGVYSLTLTSPSATATVTVMIVN